MHRLLYGSFLLVIAIASAIALTTGHLLSWFNLGVLILLIDKGLFWVRMRSKEKDRKTTNMRNSFIVLAAGYSIAALMFAISGIVGEGWFGYMAAVVFATSAIAMAFVARTTGKPYGTSEKEALSER